MSKQPKPLTPKEKSVLEYIESYIISNGFAPTFTEIKDHFGFASYNSIQRYLKQLQAKNYIHVPGGNQKRAITLLNKSSSLVEDLEKTSKDTAYTNTLTFPAKEAPSEYRSESLSLPLLGSVAAGLPIEATEDNEFIDVPLSLVKNPSSSFALSVQGESMIEDGILDGDTLIVKQQATVDNGTIAVAIIDNEATVKRVFHKKGSREIELRPSNSKMKTMIYPASQVEIKGVVTGLFRQF